MKKIISVALLTLVLAVSAPTKAFAAANCVADYPQGATTCISSTGSVVVIQQPSIAALIASAVLGWLGITTVPVPAGPYNQS